MRETIGRPVLVILLLLACGSAGVMAQDDSQAMVPVEPPEEIEVPCFDSDEEFESWMTGYHAAPAPERLDCSLFYFADSRLFLRPAGRMPVAHFHAALLRGDSDALNALYDRLNDRGSENAQIMGIHTFWVLGTPKGEALLKRAVNAGTPGTPRRSSGWGTR